MRKYFGLVLGLLISFSGYSKMAYRPYFDVPLKDAVDYFKTKGEPGEHFLGLLTVADAMKVEKFQAFSKEASEIDLSTITHGMVAKMQENPKWDVALSQESLKKIGEKQDTLKMQFGEQSYGWAWFVKQLGRKADAKKILMAVYEEGFKTIGQMRQLRFGRRSPLSEMEFVRKALEPMSNGKEIEGLDEKMRKMKNHVSNLPDSNIKT